MNRQTKSAGRFSPAFLFKQDGLHPASKIAAFILIAVLIPRLNLSAMLGLAFVLSLVLMYFRVRRFISMMQRMRWLFLSMLIIYAYTTPGEYLSRWPMDLAPSYEGLRDGCYQIARVSLVLAGISILMVTSSREKLMVGIYTLIKPLSVLRLSPERFTARLYLTLQYIEKVKKQSARQDKQSSWQESFKAYLSDSQEQVFLEVLHLEAPQFSLIDYLFNAALLMLIGFYL